MQYGCVAVRQNGIETAHHCIRAAVLKILPIVSNTSTSPLSPMPRKHLEDVLVLFPEVFVEVSVQHGVDAGIGQAQDVADAVDQGVAVAAVAHQGFQNLRAKILKEKSRNNRLAPHGGGIAQWAALGPMIR